MVSSSIGYEMWAQPAIVRAATEDKVASVVNYTRAVKIDQFNIHPHYAHDPNLMASQGIVSSEGSTQWVPLAEHSANIDNSPTTDDLPGTDLHNDHLSSIIQMSTASALSTNTFSNTPSN